MLLVPWVYRVCRLMTAVRCNVHCFVGVSFSLFWSQIMTNRTHTELVLMASMYVHLLFG
jgi:hypothetical protein